MHQFEYKPAKNTPVSDESLILDIKRVAGDFKTDILPQSLYAKHGQFDVSTIARRFGTWNKATLIAGLKPANIVSYSDQELFENILNVWQHKGRQPARRDLEFPPSRISQSPYNRRFRNWSNALKEFVNYASNADDPLLSTSDLLFEDRDRKRDPSLRLRYKVLQRDSFRCRSCGKSPAVDAGVELQIDHVIPWSSGGETVLENLQTLCSKCNVGKSNF
jgi:hypothetical protein